MPLFAFVKAAKAAHSSASRHLTLLGRQVLPYQLSARHWIAPRGLFRFHLMSRDDVPVGIAKENLLPVSLCDDSAPWSV
jgi:hypothetical protein